MRKCKTDRTCTIDRLKTWEETRCAYRRSRLLAAAQRCRGSVEDPVRLRRRGSWGTDYVFRNVFLPRDQPCLYRKKHYKKMETLWSCHAKRSLVPVIRMQPSTGHLWMRTCPEAKAIHALANLNGVGPHRTTCLFSLRALLSTV